MTTNYLPKILTCVGTRPELIRLSVILKKLDKYSNHIIVHTGQNYDPNLSDVFFKELEIREPDYYLGVKADSFGKQIGQILTKFEEVVLKEKPDKILILGDTNGSLVSIIAKRLRIPIYHLEAGNRCFDERVPEEVNRVIIDHCSTINLPYTQRSKENLIREGLFDNYIVGNPIFEVLEYYKDKISASKILIKLELVQGNYFLATIHRAENVDIEERLRHLILSLSFVSSRYKTPLILSLHPRTKSKLEKFGISTSGLIVHEPLGFFDFIKLEQNAKCLLTDSGTAIEESAIFKVPCITLRDSIERPETLECGSNILHGVSETNIINSMDIVLNESKDWIPPEGYLDLNVSEKVIKILLGYRFEPRMFVPKPYDISDN